MPSLIDVLVVLFVVVVAWNGYRSGFLLEVAGLVRLAAGLLAGVRFFPLAAAWISATFAWPPTLANLAGFLGIFVVVELLITLLYGITVYPAVEALHMLPGLGWLDRLAGMVPAALQALFWCAFALSALLLLPASPAIQNLVTQSRIGNALVIDLSTYEPRLQTLLGNAARDTLLYITPPATPTEGTIHMHFPAALPLTVDQASEQTMLNYVNEQRRQHGLAPLHLDPALTAVARAHSADMFRRSYFSHDSPDGLTPFDRMHAAGVHYTMAGENIAYAPNVTVADTGLMNSPEHRANILRPQFTRVGIGIVSGGLFEEMFTQDFAN